MAGIEKSNANLRRALRHFHLLDGEKCEKLNEHAKNSGVRFRTLFPCNLLAFFATFSFSYGFVRYRLGSYGVALCRSGSYSRFFGVSGSQVSVPYQDANNLNSPFLMLSGQDGQVRGHLEMPPGKCAHVFVRYFVIDQFV